MYPKPEPRTRRKPNPGHPYLAWLKTRPCCACGTTPTEAAHVKGPLSLKTKLPLDRRTSEAYLSAVPLCTPCHRTDPYSVHEVGERVFASDRFERMDALSGLAHAYLARWVMEGRP